MIVLSVVPQVVDTALLLPTGAPALRSCTVLSWSAPAEPATVVANTGLGDEPPVRLLVFCDISTIGSLASAPANVHVTTAGSGPPEQVTFPEPKIVTRAAWTTELAAL